MKKEKIFSKFIFYWMAFIVMLFISSFAFGQKISALPNYAGTFRADSDYIMTVKVDTVRSGVIKTYYKTTLANFFNMLDSKSNISWRASTLKMLPSGNYSVVPTGNIYELASGGLHTIASSTVTLSGFFNGGTVLHRQSLTDASTSNFLAVTGSLPSNTTSAPVGVNFQITGQSCGSSINEVQGLQVQLLGAITGTVTPIAISASNVSTGGGNITSFPSTGTAPSIACNAGIWSQANGSTSGDNVGLVSRAVNGSANFGLVSLSVGNDTKKNIGVYGAALTSSGTEVGGYFQLGTALPAFANCALMCDNGTKADDIFVARDNGTAKFTIADGGAVTCASTISATQYNVSGVQIKTTDLSDVASGTFTPTYTGFSSNPSIVAEWSKVGKVVTISFSCASRGTSNASTFTITNLPYTASSTASTQQGCAIVSDNSIWRNSDGIWLISAGSSTIQFGYATNAVAGGFTASGSKGVSCIIQYLTD